MCHRISDLCYLITKAFNLTIRVERSDELGWISMSVAIGSCCKHATEEHKENDAHERVCAASVHLNACFQLTWGLVLIVVLFMV